VLIILMAIFIVVETIYYWNAPDKPAWVSLASAISIMGVFIDMFYG